MEPTQTFFCRLLTACCFLRKPSGAALYSSGIRISQSFELEVLGQVNPCRRMTGPPSTAKDGQQLAKKEMELPRETVDDPALLRESSSTFLPAVFAHAGESRVASPGISCAQRYRRNEQVTPWFALFCEVKR
jgi:hypothetical protein